jgi:preprotein translocase subunit SecB
MNDNSGNGADGAPQNGEAQAQQSAITINGQYIKDLSFEAPNSPQILNDLQSQQPDVNINVDVQATKLEQEGIENLFESILDIRAELKIGEKVGFILELKYAGVFTLNVPEEHLGAMLLIECPRLLFPFTRNILADTTRDGGFVPLLLQPIDFAAMYQANVAQQVKELDEEVAEITAPKGNA